MKIRKAIIPAAGYGTRFLPVTKSIPKEMLPIIDKPTIQYIVEEAVQAGIEEILLISNTQKATMESYFDRNWGLEYFLVRKGNDKALEEVKKVSEIANVYIVRQKAQKGLGDAILCAKSFVENEPFAVLLGDDLIDNTNNPSIKQLCDFFEKVQSSIVGVQQVSYFDLNKYGIIKPKGEIETNYSEIEDIVEKPNPEVAPSRYAALGRYILTPKIFEILETQKAGYGGEIHITDAIKKLIEYEKVYGYEFIGKRYDVGSKIGYLEATIDYALKRDDLKDEFEDLLRSRYKFGK